MNEQFNPYPGLRPFEPHENYLFFGREGQSNELLSRLRKNRFLAVVGTSGSGKSSLVRAGLLPDLHSGLMSGVSSRWHVALFRPGANPIGNLAEALCRRSVLLGSEIPAEDIPLQVGFMLATLNRSAMGIVEGYRQSGLSAEENVLIVVDQFEELFRFKNAGSAADASDEAAAFVKLLLSAARQPDVPLYVVITMRSDFLGDCAEFRDLPEAINEGQYLIPRMTRDERRQAITGPAGVGGAQITPRLVQRLLNDVGDNPDQLPILQHALMRTWDQWKSGSNGDKPLDTPNYETIGGMEKALSLHADEVLDELAAGQSKKIAARRQYIVQKMFKSLTEKGKYNRETRRSQQLSNIAAITGASEDEVREIVRAFRKPGRSFLMPPEPEPLTSGSLIDISHESLIRNWGRLKQWVADEAESVRIFSRLIETAELFGQKKSSYYRGVDLKLALTWQEKEKPGEAWARGYGAGYAAAMEFLDASRRRANTFRAMRYSLLAVGLLLTGGFLLYRYLAVGEHQYYYRSSVRQHGIMTGIGELDYSQVRHRSVSLKFVYRGAIGGGARVAQWVRGALDRAGFARQESKGPRLIRVEAINAGGKLTSEHEIGTYLSSEPTTECQWEYDYSANGEVVYEKAFDTYGRPVWGLVYSPMSDSVERQALYLGSELSHQHTIGDSASANVLHPSSDSNVVNISAPGGSTKERTGVVGAKSGGHFVFTESKLVHVRYDALGYDTLIRYYDMKHTSVVGLDSAFGRSQRFDSLGRLVEMISLDSLGQPMNDGFGNAALRWQYARDGTTTAEALDKSGALILTKGGWAKAKFIYDAYGNLEEATYLGLDGKPVVTSDSYAGWRSAYDDRGNDTATTYFGASHEPINIDQGYSKVTRRFDRNSVLVGGNYFDASGKPVLSKDGYAGWTDERDSDGRLSRRKFRLVPDSARHGYTSWQNEYDINNYVVAISYFDAGDNPVINTNEDYHKVARRYDSNDRILEEEYFGIDSTLRIGKAGCARKKMAYDDRGNQISTSYFGLNSRPIINRKEGYHRISCTYDSIGRIVNGKYFDVDGTLMFGNDGYAGWHQSYDGNGRLSMVTYLGKNDSPMVTRGKYAGWKQSYNRDGRVTRVTFLGTDNSPVITNDGYAIREYRYDRRGNEISTVYFGIDGRKTDNSSGYHRVVRTFDRNGNTTEERYFSADGNAAGYGIGFPHVCRYVYDQSNLLIETSVYDGKGRLRNSSYGDIECARWVARRDKDGRIVEEKFYDANNVLVKTTAGENRVISARKK